MIEFKNVTKTFNKFIVLDNISFRVPTGSVSSLLGLSGSGKTTVLKIVCGLHSYDSGEVTIDGEPVNLKSVVQFRKKIGYVVQEGGLFPHLTAQQNISIVGKESRWDVNKINNRVIELCELTKISNDLLNKYPKELSGGQRQRIGIMRALFLDPPLLLLDEPLGALDPITRSEIQTELKILFKNLNKTVLLVTHDLFEAGYLADQILLLNKGQIAQSGKMLDLLKNPVNDFVKLFTKSQRYPDFEGQY